jgi:hypothetical protein
MAMLAAVPDPSELVPELSLDDLKALSDDEVTDSMLLWAGRVAAGEARLLAFLGEFDARGQWSGFPSCAAWLSWRLAIGPKAAAEKVRVARRLRELPVTRAVYERGELSYTQVRAVTRVVRVDTEQELLPVFRSCSGEQIERLARGIRRAKAADDPLTQSTRYGVTVRYDPDGTAVITARMPAEQATIVLAALDTCQNNLAHAANPQSSAEAEPAPDAPSDADQETGQEAEWVSEPAAQSSAEDFAEAADACSQWPAEPAGQDTGEPVGPERQAVSRQQALLQLAQDWLDHQSSSVRRKAKPRLTALIDPISGWARLHNGELLPPAITATIPFTTFDLGRRRREVDRALRQFLGEIDGERCRFPGCRHTRFLHAHHVIWWSHGGPTDLANLVLLCSRHHRLVHDEQFTLTLDDDRTLTVHAADGTPLPTRPDLPHATADDLDPAGTITPDTSPNPYAVDRLHLAYAVSVLAHLAA